MKLLACFILLVSCVSVGTYGVPTPVPANGGSSNQSETAPDDSPQYLYMQKLHDRLKDTKQMEGADQSSVGGSLLATSIEADAVTGPGYPEYGFTLQETNTYILEFSIPRQEDSTTIQSAELWVFPTLPKELQETFSDDTSLRITIPVIVELSHANKPRREILQVTWRKEMGCLTLNMTALSKKISKNLKKKDLEKANITVTIEVVAINSEVSKESSIADENFVEMCNALSKKTSNTPFLVMKYYSDKLFDSTKPLTDSHLQKRQLDPLPVSTSSSPSACAVVPLVVDLTELYGNFIIKPTHLDISDCYGSCSVLQNSDKFSHHATILERLKLVSGGAIRDVSCVPVAYKSQDLLIYQSNYYVLVEFMDMIVTQCACQ